MHARKRRRREGSKQIELVSFGTNLLRAKDSITIITATFNSITNINHVLGKRAK